MSIEADLQKILTEYADDVNELSNDVMKKTAQKAVRTLKSTSPKESGAYASSWTMKSEKLAGGSMGFTVYNAKYPHFTTWLENGHLSKNQYGTYGRVPAKPHIKQAEQQAVNEIIKTLEARL